jgi:hypothetical protein
VDKLNLVLRVSWLVVKDSKQMPISRGFILNQSVIIDVVWTVGEASRVTDLPHGHLHRAVARAAGAAVAYTARG